MYLKIQAEIKNAMKEKNQNKKDVLRQVTAKAQMTAKEAKVEITDDIVLSSIQKELKQLNQTKDSIPEGTDLYNSTLYKIGILKEYLPKQMTADEVRVAIEQILSTGDYQNMGAKMKAVMAELKGKADNKLISQIVKEF